MPRIVLVCLAILALTLGSVPARVAAVDRLIGINVVLNTDATDAIIADLGSYGRVTDVIAEIDAVTLQAWESQLAVIQALPYVAAANPDAERQGAPIDTVAVSDFENGISTWDLDAINVTDRTTTRSFNGRVETFDGTGVYVAVLDTGLLDSWRQYFPEQRIATQFAAAFSGGGAGDGATPETPNVWEHDQNSHGTHVTSTILGYQYVAGIKVNGTAPLATVIPVKVLNQAGFGWSSMIARGIVYVTDLKTSGALGTSPVVINMSLGGPTLDAVEQAAIDFAVANNVIVVASAGNAGPAGGMGFPGAYQPVISVAASGWINEWKAGDGFSSLSWWRLGTSDPTDTADFYIARFSSRQKSGQDLDVAAPGSWVVGPFQLQSGKTSYFFLGGTSMSSPHVAGIVALMAQKKPSLTPAEAESILTSTAIPLSSGCRFVIPRPDVAATSICWGGAGGSAAGEEADGAGLATADAALAGTIP